MTNVSQNPMDRQFDLEGLMVGLGEKAYRDHNIQARMKGNETMTSYGRFLVKAGVEPVAREIREYYDHAMSGGAGRRTTCARLLHELIGLFDDDVDGVTDRVAYIALKVVINQVSNETRAQTLGQTIGAHIEDEARFKHFKDSNVALFDKVNRDLDKRTRGQDHKKTVIRRQMNRDENTPEWAGWGMTKRLQLGMVLLELVIKATGIAKIQRINESATKTHYYVQPTSETAEWIQQRGEYDALLCPQQMPCVVPPRDWTNPYDGGYHTDRAQAGAKLIKAMKEITPEQKKHYLQEMTARADEMPELYEAINAMQQTAWQINPEVYPTFLHIWDNMDDTSKAGLPAWIDYKPVDVMPPYPEGGTDDEQRQWKRRASDIWTTITRENSRVIQTSKIKFVASKLANEPEIYFPYQLDFRGRVYAMPAMLHPQGSDVAKGLLRFAEGKPLADDTAVRWWKIHGANVWGEDKLTLDARVDWVNANHSMLERIGRDPLEHTDWFEADKPWQALAFCMEYARREDEGHKFCSHLSVQLDGSCNGLQHFSAMLRDPIGGEATNLRPLDAPEDIYQRVADRTTEKLQQIVDSDKGDTVHAARWLAIGLTRKTTKRAVMIRPYGGTQRATTAYVRHHMNDDRTATEREILNPDDPKDVFRACSMLSKVIHESLDEIVVASAEAMGWLQKVAKLASKEDLPVTWETPVGFRVLQAYPNLKPRRITTMLGDSMIKLTMVEQTDTIDRSKQANGISPNFVHSLDAAAMIRYVCYARAKGLRHFSTVHDSYGVHAADTQASVDSIREAFVSIYTDSDPLPEFRDNLIPILSPANQKKVPALPEKGSLDINEVLQSDYFFA